MTGTQKPKILLMGLRRGGKSSIRQVIFHNMQPLETLYLESTTKPIVDRFESLVDFQLQEIPGHLDMFEHTLDRSDILQGVSSIVYVIDSQDEYLSALQNIVLVIEQAYRHNPRIKFEILIHKVDGLNEDFRQDTQRDIIQRVTDELQDVGIEDANISYHMTSIFDNSIVEAFSRIVQKLVPELGTLTQLLDIFCLRSGVEKAFLFDVSKIYLATDSSPIDVETYQVCSDFIDVALDLDKLYKKPGVSMINSGTLPDPKAVSAPSSSTEDITQLGQESAANSSPIQATSKLANGTTIYLNKMIKGLLLVCLARSAPESTAVLMEQNIEVLHQGLQMVYSSV